MSAAAADVRDHVPLAADDVVAALVDIAALRGALAGVRRDAADVEDQRDLAMAEDRCARVADDVAQALADRLHDDLLGILRGVDDEAERAAFVLEDDDGRAGRASEAAELREIGQWKQLVAEAVDRRD